MSNLARGWTTWYVWENLSGRSKTEVSTTIRFHASVLAALFALVSAGLGGCAGPGSVQNNPSAQKKYVFASAYSKDKCQAKMDVLAGTDVQMIEDDKQVVTSIFSLGIVPSHRCIGIARDSTVVGPLSPLSAKYE